MKKIFLILLVGLFAVIVAACGNLPTLESISIEGQDVEFYVGEEFNTKDLVVTAKLSDATTKVVTDQAEVTHNVDTTQAGTYTVTVTYKNLSETYDVTVIADVLVNFVIEGLKTEYKIGEEVSFEGVVAKEIYQSGNEVAADLSSYAVVLKANETEYAGAFNQIGKHTVTISKGQVVYSYDVNVSANIYSSIADAINAGKANADKVSKGSAIIDNEGYVLEQNYEFGENYTKVGNADETYHYVLLEDGTAFGLYEYVDWEGNPTVEPAYEPLPENLLGVDFRSVLSYAYDMFGVEDLVETLAFIGAEAINYVEVLPEEASEEVSYEFSFEIIIDDFYYYFINVKFALDATSEIITEVEVNMKGYMFVYNEKSGEYEQPAEFAEPDFVRVITVSQEKGERNAENPYPVDELFIQSFDLINAEGEKLENGASLTAALRVDYVLEVANINPENANASVDKINVIVLDSEGFETYSVFGSYDYGYITVTAYSAGTYQLVISSTNVTYTFEFIVDYSPLESFVAGVFDEDWYSLVEADSATVYANQVLQFGAIVNDGANSACIVSCEGAEIMQGEYYEFIAQELGTYTITLTSAVNPEFTATITVTVEEAPSVDEILNGKYQFNSPMLGSATFEFTPAYEGATSGVLVIDYEGAYVPAGTGYFDYAYFPGWLQLTPQNPGSYNCPYGVELDETYSLMCTYNGFPQGKLVKVEGSDSVEGALSGIYAATFIHPMNGFEFSFQLSFNANGTGSYSFMNNAYEGTFNYSNVEGVITFSEVVALFGADVVINATIADNVISCTSVFTDQGNELTLEYTGGEEVQEEATTTPVVGENTVFVSMRGTELYFTPEESGSYTISIDGSIAGILIEQTDVWYEAEYTLDLEANVPLLIVIVTATWSTPDQNTTLTITKN